jgi:hypothetical protein
VNDWTIDTDVLYRAKDADWDAIAFLHRVLDEREMVAFDHEGHIESEYRRCLGRDESSAAVVALRKWFVEIVNKFAFKYSGTLSNRHQGKLLELCFDCDDWPFVCVASKTQTKRLVAEESDYSATVCRYLHDKMHVVVLNVAEAAAIPTAS